MAGMADRSQPPHVRVWQDVLNEHWPDRPADFRRREPGIPVRARLVFERDGETWLDGTARRWSADHVYVEIDDRRISTNGAWLKPHDLYRRKGTELAPK